MERAPVTVCLLLPDHNIPDWSTKIVFLGEDETTIRSDIKSRHHGLLARVTPFWACGFLFNKLKIIFVR